jgi:type IV pilus assembly protein PilA
MLKSIRNKMEDRDEGFTLIELMVVVLIIAILIAIAIPTFLGARKRAQDRAVQSNLRNALTAEKVYYTDAQAYTTNGPALTSIEPSLTYAAAVSPTDIRTVRVLVGNITTGATINSGVVCLAAQSASGTTFALKDVAAGTNAGTTYDKVDFVGVCNDTNLPLQKW